MSTFQAQLTFITEFLTFRSSYCPVSRCTTLPRMYAAWHGNVGKWGRLYMISQVVQQPTACKITCLHIWHLNDASPFLVSTEMPLMYTATLKEHWKFGLWVSPGDFSCCHWNRLEQVTALLTTEQQHSFARVNVCLEHLQRTPPSASDR